MEPIVKPLAAVALVFLAASVGAVRPLLAARVQTLIIDVRDNPGGDNSFVKQFVVRVP